MGANVKFECTECKKLYDDQDSALACSTRRAWPEGTRFLSINGNFDRGILEVVSAGLGCQFYARVKPARGFRDIVPSSYRPNPGGGTSRRVRAFGSDKLTPITPVEIADAVRYFNQCAKHKLSEAAAYTRLAKHAETMSKSIPKETTN